MASAAGPVGIIYPPRDIRGVIDKTAQFVAKCGPEFEGRVRKEQNSKKFEFLDPGHPFRPYYEFKVKEFQAGKEGETKVDKPAALLKAEAEIAAKKEKKVLKMLDNKEHVDKEEEILPPPPDAYTVVHPTITPLDADVIQLTAQFVARNGQKFLIGLTQRESRNPQFDFLKPTHPLFSYFTSLVDGYTKVLMPSKEEIAEIKRYLGPTGFTHILEKSRRRYRWEAAEEKKKKVEEQQKQLEREQMDMIDWHDFVVVETIDFNPEDDDNPLAAPIDTTKAAPEEPVEPLDVETKVMPGAIIEEEEPMELDMEVETRVEKKDDDKKAQKKLIEDADKDDFIDEDVMDISDEEGEEIEMEKKPREKAEKEDTKPEDDDVIPVPDDLAAEKAPIKAGYVRTKKKEPELQQLQKCPLTGQFLPVDDMNEHLRIAMLNPQWKKDQDSQQTKKKQENLFAEDVEANLAAFVAKRPDIFGTVDEEIQVAAEAGAEQSAREAGADAGPAASVYNPEAVKSLPPAPPSASVGGMPPQHMMQMHALPSNMAQNNMYHGMQPPPHMLPGFKQLGEDEDEDEEPNAKRQKIETTLLPEFQWAQSHPRAVQIKIRISPELGISKTELTVTVEVTKTILTFKTMLESLTGIVASKMQLRDDRTTLVMRQTRSLAFYNLKEGSSVEMMPKERGGKRK